MSDVSKLDTPLQIALGRVPEYMREPVAAYVLHGRRPGDFLHAVFCNNLVHAVDRADRTNSRHLADWAQVVKRMPAGSVGSLEAVHAWKGLE